MEKIFIKKSEICAAVERLRGTKIHSHFAGYLCVKWGQRVHLQSPVLSHEFKSFFDTYFAVPGGPDGYPYARFFTTNGDQGSSAWINANVAGSYAPSSIRPDKPLGKVLLVNGNGTSATYDLVKNHEKVVLSQLLSLQKISAMDLAIVLFRNFAFDSAQKPINLVSIFKDQFGYRDSVPRERKAFETIFEANPSGLEADKLFEAEEEA